MPTIRLSEKTYKMLIRRQAELMKKTGRRVTIDEVIHECLKSISSRDLVTERGGAENEC